MKRKFNIITKALAALILLGTITLTSCKKDEVQGPKGDTGAAGADGAANIQNYNITINPADWSWYSLYKEWNYPYYVDASSNSAIMAYSISGDGEEVLPYLSQIYGTTLSFSSYLFSSSSRILFKYYNGTTTLARPTGSYYIRLVIIPPAMIKPGVDLTNYKAVKEAYHLK